MTSQLDSSLQNTTLSPIEQFFEQKKLQLEEFKKNPGSYVMNLEILKKCSIVSIDLRGDDTKLMKLRTLFSSSERTDTISHLPCLLYPHLDGMMTLPLVPVQMGSTIDLENDRTMMNNAGSNYIYRGTPSENNPSYSISFFSAESTSYHFGVSGVTLPGFAMTYEEAGSLLGGGIEILELLVSDVPGRFIPGKDKSCYHNADNELSIWLDNTGFEDFAMISSKKGLGYNVSKFGYPMYGILDFPESMRDRVHGILES